MMRTQENATNIRTMLLEEVRKAIGEHYVRRAKAKAHEFLAMARARWSGDRDIAQALMQAYKAGFWDGVTDAMTEVGGAVYAATAAQSGDEN